MASLAQINTMYLVYIFGILFAVFALVAAYFSFKNLDEPKRNSKP